jgi:hypothetical protein
MEVGVEVFNYYYIDLPSDCRKVLDIHYPGKPQRHYGWELVNGQLKLEEKVTRDESPTSYTLSLGSKTQVTINDSTAEEDDHNLSLLVPTNGNYTDPILLGKHNAASGGVTVLNFLHAISKTLSATAGYITSDYLWMIYRASFERLTDDDDEIPIDDKHEDILKWYLCMLASSDKKDIQLYHDLFEEEKMEMEADVFTPSPAEAKPAARSMPALEDVDTDDTKFTFTGDTE